MLSVDRAHLRSHSSPAVIQLTVPLGLLCIYTFWVKTCTDPKQARSLNKQAFDWDEPNRLAL